MKKIKIILHVIDGVVWEGVEYKGSYVCAGCDAMTNKCLYGNCIRKSMTGRHYKRTGFVVPKKNESNKEK